MVQVFRSLRIDVLSSGGHGEGKEAGNFDFQIRTFYSISTPGFSTMATTPSNGNVGASHVLRPLINPNQYLLNANSMEVSCPPSSSERTKLVGPPPELIGDEKVERKDYKADSYQELQIKVQAMRNAVISRTDDILVKLQRGAYSKHVSEEASPKTTLLLDLINVGSTQAGWITLAQNVANGHYNF
jgi:hypothetical protein